METQKKNTLDKVDMAVFYLHIAALCMLFAAILGICSLAYDLDLGLVVSTLFILSNIYFIALTQQFKE